MRSLVFRARSTALLQRQSRSEWFQIVKTFSRQWCQPAIALGVALCTRPGCGQGPRIRKRASQSGIYARGSTCVLYHRSGGVCCDALLHVAGALRGCQVPRPGLDNAPPLQVPRKGATECVWPSFTRRSQLAGHRLGVCCAAADQATEEAPADSSDDGGATPPALLEVKPRPIVAIPLSQRRSFMLIPVGQPFSGSCMQASELVSVSELRTSLGGPLLVRLVCSHHAALKLCVLHDATRTRLLLVCWGSLSWAAGRAKWLAYWTMKIDMPGRMLPILCSWVEARVVCALNCLPFSEGGQFGLPSHPSPGTSSRTFFKSTLLLLTISHLSFLALRRGRAC